MYTYVAFYKNQQREVQASTSLEARDIAATLFKAKRAYEVTVVVAARPDGTPVVHTPTV